MSAVPVFTRFAPSPSGELHLGNARPALFSALLAQLQSPILDAEAAAAVSTADRGLVTAAAAGLKGPALFKPLRAALTGRHGASDLRDSRNID